MQKYKRVRQALQADLRQADALFTPSPLATHDELTTVHTHEYVASYVEGRLTPAQNRRVGFPWSQASVDRSLSSTGGTVAAARAVCEKGVVFAGHLAGGTHHSFADRGEGFCVFNDIAVAARVALRDYSSTVSSVLIVDLDVHQGNGCAHIFKDDPSVFTFSMQCASNYFSARQESDLDVDVPAGTQDAEYLSLLADHLPRVFRTVRPSLTFFQAGCDPHEDDALGKLRLSREGLRARNRLVYRAALEYDSPVVVTMGGGYPRDLSVDSAPFETVVQCHADVYRDCVAIAQELA
jgi:acetoin utilization deacetylase AcuC-like enzyme